MKDQRSCGPRQPDAQEIGRHDKRGRAALGLRRRREPGVRPWSSARGSRRPALVRDALIAESEAGATAYGNRDLPTQSRSASTPLRPAWTLQGQREQLSRCRQCGRRSSGGLETNASSAEARLPACGGCREQDRRGCSTPKAAMLAALPLHAKRGSLVETAAGATLRKSRQRRGGHRRRSKFAEVLDDQRGYLAWPVGRESVRAARQGCAFAGGQQLMHPSCLDRPRFGRHVLAVVVDCCISELAP